MWKKRYSFRLTDLDKDVYDFIQTSKESDSETIRRLLKFAIKYLNGEIYKPKENKKLIDLTTKIDDIQQDINLIKQILNEGVVYKNRENAENNNGDELNLDKSIDSMLNAFGFDD